MPALRTYVVTETWTIHVSATSADAAVWAASKAMTDQALDSVEGTITRAPRVTDITVKEI